MFNNSKLVYSDINMPAFIPISITEKAYQEISNIINNKNIPKDYGLRVGVSGGGCSGVSYILGFDKKGNTDDEYELRGIKIFMNKKHAMFVMGLEIDFEETAETRGFTFNPPS
jgi:iron-sulfur cluster assembly protein